MGKGTTTADAIQRFIIKLPQAKHYCNIIIVISVVSDLIARAYVVLSWPALARGKRWLLFFIYNNLWFDSSDDRRQRLCEARSATKLVAALDWPAKGWLSTISPAMRAELSQTNRVLLNVGTNANYTCWWFYFCCSVFFNSSLPPFLQWTLELYLLLCSYATGKMVYVSILYNFILCFTYKM